MKNDAILEIHSSSKFENWKMEKVYSGSLYEKYVEF